MYSTTTRLWEYLQCVNKLNTVYMSGKFGQLINNKYAYDCVCLIKSFAWCNGIAGNTPIYKANGVLDDWIGALYSKATRKGTMNTLPTEGILLVYLNNSHIGVYNSSTKEVIECCAGATNKVIKRKMSHYKNTIYEWNKWSNLYWCADTTSQTMSSITNNQLTATSYPNYTGKAYYRIRKSWEDVKSQIGAYSVWNNALSTYIKNKSKGYHIYDNNGRRLD